MTSDSANKTWSIVNTGRETLAKDGTCASFTLYYYYKIRIATSI